MSNFTIKIEAPEIVEVIKALVLALANNAAPVVHNVVTNTEAPLQAPFQPAMTNPYPDQGQPMTNVVPIPTAPPVVYAQPEPQYQQQAPAQVTAVPTTPQSFSLEQLAVAATQINDAGRRNELVALINSFGVQSLTALPKEMYGAFATQLRAMGAKI